MQVKLVQDSELKTRVNDSLREGIEKLAGVRKQSVAEVLRNLVAEAIVNAISTGELKYDRPPEMQNATFRKIEEAFRQAGKERRRIEFDR